MRVSAKQPSLARQIVGILINAIGIAAAVCGGTLAYNATTSAIDLVRLIHAAPQGGLAGPGIAVVGMLDVMIVFVLGTVAVLSLALAAWILEPMRRWREWRGKTRTRSQ